MNLHRSLLRGRRGRSGALAALLLVPLSGCTAFTDYNEETEAPRQAFARGDFAGAVAGYREGFEAVNDSLLYHFEGGAAAHVGGMYEESIKLFDVATRKIEEYQLRALAADAAQTAASILVNEKTISYSGDVFEQVLVQAYQARNFYLADKRDTVNVEVRRCYLIIDKAREIYEKELSEAQQEASSSNEGVDVAGVEAKMRETYSYGDLSGVEDVYDISYVRYLNSFLREAVGFRQADYNDAWFDMKFVAKRFEGEEFVQRDLLRLARKSGAASQAGDLERKYNLRPLPPDTGSVALFFECGMAPRKTEVKVIFPTLHGAAAIAMPRYEAVPNPAAAAMLVVGDQQVRTTTLSNLQSIAYRYQHDRLPLLIAKQVIRLAAKVAIQEGGHAVIANNAGEGAALWAGLFSLGMSIWNVASEQADLRAWRTLPQTMQVARVYLPEGEYPARLVLLGPGGNAMRELDLGTITVKADKHRMVNARSVGTNLFVDVSKEPYDGQAAPAGPTTVVQEVLQPDARQPDRPRPRERDEDRRRAPDDVRRGPAGGGGAGESSTTDLRRPDAGPATPPAGSGGGAESSRSTDLWRPDAEPAAPPASGPAGESSGSSDLMRPDAAPADAADTGETLDRLARLLQPGRRVCFQVVFENGQGRDFAGNATVDEMRDEADEGGRRLVVMTSNFDHDGVPNYFCFVVREGGLEQVELMAAPTGAWEVVPRETFWFKAIPGGEVRFEGPGRAIASRRGVVNRQRGAKARGQASVYLRTYQVDGAGALRY